MWGLILELIIEYKCFDWFKEFLTEEVLDDPIRIDEDECGSYAGKYLVFIISLYNIVQNLRLIQNIHETHIFVLIVISDLVWLSNGNL